MVKNDTGGRLTKIYFWCKRCRKDWERIGVRRIKSSHVGEVWTARCPDCKWEMVRLINNPFDPFYRVSVKIRRERKIYAKDLLQPGDPGFDILYPQHKKQREAYYKNLEKGK
jgi:hypothetical protein